MKKFNILATTALIATIGSVYATWVYASEEATAGEITVAVSVAGKGEAMEKGTIEVTGEVALLIDDTNGDYKAELIVDESKDDKLTVTFTPKRGASEDVIAYGIVMEYVLSVSGYEYEGESIFTVSDTATAIKTAIKDGDAAFSTTISAQEICNAIKMSEIVLDTEAEYGAFKDGLTGGSIKITVREKTAQTA